MQTIKLHWVGPYKHGSFHELNEKDYPNVNEPHVYVRIQAFQVRKIVAVGKATNLIDRMNQHIRDLLSRQYWLSTEENAHKIPPASAEGLRIYDELDAWLPVAKDEVKHFSFFAAPCPSEALGYAEAELIARFLKVADESNGKIVKDNWKNERRSPDGITLKYSYRSPEAKQVVEFVPDLDAPRES